MAFPEPKNNKEQTNTPKRYIGVATCRIAGINVNNEQFKAITGHERKKPLEVLERSEKNPNYVKANFEIILETVPEHCNGIKATFIKRLGISNTILSSKNGKVCMIDQYGRTAWLNSTDAANKNVPFLIGSSDKGQYVRRIEPSSMRQAYGGEELTMNFLRALFGVLDVSKMEEDGDKKVYRGALIDNPKPTRIEDIPALFRGDFREFNQAVESVKDNWVKIAVGVGKTENSTIHVIYDYFMRPFEGVGNCKYKIENDSKNDFKNAEWDYGDLHVYKKDGSPKDNVPVTATGATQPITQPKEDGLPF